MKAFVSLGYYSTREQELVSSGPVLSYLLDVALRAVAGVPGLEAVAVLHTTSVDLPECPLPAYRMRGGDRLEAELEAVRSILGESGACGRVMVLRPAHGAVFSTRVAHFHVALEAAGGPLAVSVIPFGSMSHPMWNAMAVDRRHHAHGVIRRPRGGSFQASSLYVLAPELWGEMHEPGAAQGSQHLKSLYHDDGALYAVDPDRISGDAPAPPRPEPVPCPCDAPADENWLVRLPVFQLSREQVPDIQTLERIVAVAGRESEESA